MRDAMARRRERRLVGEAIEAPLSAAGFVCARRGRTWARRRGEVVQAIGFVHAPLARDRSLEWGIWAPELSQLFGEPSPIATGELRTAHLRGGDHRLPSTLRTSEGLLDLMQATHCTVQGFLRICDEVDSRSALRARLAADIQRLWPPSDLRPLYLAGLAVLDRSPDASSLAERAINRCHPQADWLPVARRVDAAARAATA